VSGQRSRVTTHVLDATSGRPAVGIEATLERESGTSWQDVTSGRTDADGRISAFGPADLAAGVYQVTFATGPYFAERGQPTFYPEVTIPFTIDDPAAHYHVPLLLSPYAYSTYRGS
jgi:5-hydroxyisourate hydrolase